jgi:hypothetical protein
MADLRVDIKTTADVSGANAATEALKATTAAANQLGSSAGAATSAVSTTQDALKETSKQSADLSSQLVETARRADEAQAAIAGVAGKSEGVAGAAATAAKSTAQLGSSFSDLIRRGSPAHELLDGVLQGSLRSSTGVLALTRAVTGLFRGFSAGGIGLFVTALAGAAGVALLLAKHLNITGESAEEAKKKLDETKKSAEELGRTELTQLETSLSKVTAQAQRETKAFNELEAAKGKVANADLALRTAQIQNDPKLTNEQKVTAELKLRSDFKKADDARELAVEQQKVAEAKKVADAANQNLVAPAAQVKAFDEETDRLRKQREQREQVKADISNVIQDKAASTPANAGIGIAAGAFSPEVQKLTEQLNKLPIITEEQIKASEAQADAVRKTLEAEKEKARIAQETYADAEASLRLLTQTQKTVQDLTQKTTQITAVPEIVKARQTDREVKVQTEKDRTNPQADKLVPVLASLDQQIKELRDAASNNLRSSKDPENIRLNAQADALQAQRDSTQSQFDAFSRNPTKADIKKSDVSAAKSDTQKLKLDTKPVEDAETKKNDEVLKLAQDNNSGLKNIADTITALPPPPKPDTGPVLSGLIEYNGKTIEAFRNVNQNFIEIGKTLRDQARQIEALSRQASQASP